MSRRKRSPRNPASLLRFGRAGSWPVHPVAVLMGLAAGWQWSGMRMVLSSAIDPLPATATMLGAIALLTAAVGPWLPERVVLGVARFIRRRRRGDGPAADGVGTLWMLPAVRDRDESLMWLSLSVLASVAGAASLLTIALSGLFIRLYHYLLDHFFWTSLTLAALEWLSVTLLVGASWVIHGVMAVALSPLAGRRSASQRLPSGVAAGVLLGLGLAWVLHEVWADWGLSGGQEFMLGVVPMFVLAGVSARLSQRADRLPQVATEADAGAPELTAGTEGLIWLSLVVLGIASVLVGSGWLACRWATLSKWSPGNGGLGWYILLLGLGVAVASFHARRGQQSASGCGMAAWAAGVGAGAAATLMSYRPTGTVTTMVQVVLLAVPVGYALHYAERAWLARVGSETLGFAQLSSAILAGLGIGLIGARWWALPTLGAMGMTTAGALMMLASGGLMQVYEEDRPVRIRHLRLALVFASLAGAIVLFPSDAKRWARGEREHRAPERSAIDFEELAAGVAPGVRSICLIGVDPIGVGHWSIEASRCPGLKRARIDVIPIAPRMPTAMMTSPAPERTRVLAMSAFRALRLERCRYDLIYQRATASRPLGRFAEYSAEWLARLAEHALPGGRLTVDVPLAGTTTGTIAVVAATFEHAVGAAAAWRLVDVGGQAVLRLTARPGAATPVNPGHAGPWSLVRCLLSDRPDLQVHSLRRDRITHTLKTDVQDVSSLVQWLEQCRSKGRAPGGS